ncbi:contact-dependent growth inhibition system immunity protein [Curtobacterium sp. L1-20]|uniref:contact-dependent growth inhibition system immunity protein n=1 Tax=Curtobacterium sp. L1-20 TaxID=3138181 RepID=UPI003B52E2FF
MTEKFAALDDFIGGYFHRKWAEAGMSPVDVMTHFFANARRGEIQAVADDVRGLLELDDESIAACLVGLDCNYDPAEDNSTDRSGLEWMLRQFEAHAEAPAPPESAVVGSPGWQRASRPIRGASPRVAVVRFLTKYGVGEGRASRSESWWARFLWRLVCVGLVIAASAVPYEARTPFTIAFLVWLAATAIPNITLQARRLHDTGRSTVRPTGRPAALNRASGRPHRVERGTTRCGRPLAV